MKPAVVTLETRSAPLDLAKRQETPCGYLNRTIAYHGILLNMPATNFHSVAEDKTIEQDIASSHIKSLRTAIWVFDIDHSKVVWANEAALKVWGAETLDELKAREMASDMSVSVAQRLKQYQEDFTKSDVSYAEVWTLYPDGNPVTLDVHFKGYHFSDGRIGMLCEAMSQRSETPDGLRSAEALLHTSVMISLYDQNGNVLYSNPAARASLPENVNNLPDRFFHQSDYFNLTGQLQLNGGCQTSTQIKTTRGVRWHEITARECLDAVTGQKAILLSEIDITELKETEQHAQFLADHDTLTGLPNRNFVQKIIPKKLISALEFDEKLAFLLIDVDRFKTVNDTLGHAAGDDLLVQVSARLLDISKNKGMVARLGGDEFLICLSNLQSWDEVDEFCIRLVREFQTIFTISEKELHATLSVGVSRYPEDADNIHELLRFADVAMYEAKKDGRNNYSCFNSRLREKIDGQMTLERDLRGAIEANQFELFYQPRLNSFTNEIVGGEALIRWNHPTRGMLMPNQFIDTAEEMGLINEIGDWVMTQAASEQAYLEQIGFPITVSLNLSPKQFDFTNMLANVLSLQERTGCSPEKIELEITETTLMRNDKFTRDLLATIQDRGFGIAIDDFGTGYSNLAYIQNYPVTSLKIDRSFISNIDKNHAVTQLIVSLCKLLHINAVAEGVETQEQLDWLRRHGCKEYQGFLFSPPINRSAFLQLLQSQKGLMNFESENQIYPLLQSSTG